MFLGMLFWQCKCIGMVEWSETVFGKKLLVSAGSFCSFPPAGSCRDPPAAAFSHELFQWQGDPCSLWFWEAHLSQAPAWPCCILSLKSNPCAFPLWKDASAPNAELQVQMWLHEGVWSLARSPETCFVWGSEESHQGHSSEMPNQWRMWPAESERHTPPAPRSRRTFSVPRCLPVGVTVFIVR